MGPSPEQKAILERWRTVIAQRDPTIAAQFTDNEPAGHMLHVFRPDGAGLEALFDGMPRGDEVLARLRQLFDAPACSSRPGEAPRPRRKGRTAARADLGAVFGQLRDRGNRCRGR
jgi:hypothetical protein